MAKIRTIVRNDEADRLQELVGNGTLRLIEEVVDGERIMMISTRSGQIQAVVGKKVRHYFTRHFMERGSGDGLFSGFHQTTM